jgi:transposase
MTKNDQFSEQLTSKQYQLIELLLAGVNVAAAARQLKIGDKTARRWLAQAHFQQAYKQAQQDMFTEALSELKGGMRDVLATLRRHLLADTIPTPASQMQAVKVWSDLVTSPAFAEEEQEQQYDVRELLRLCDEDELQTIQAIIRQIDARKALTEQSAPSIRMVK